ncbi:MAG: hypothetical protein NUV59_00305 [Patescibacteria group bacterium]|nr:hypothetical protein [Patescibacteria group bacterium]
MIERIKSTDTRSLVYNEDFRAWLKANPETVRALKDVLKQLDSMTWQQLAEHPSFISESGTINLIKGWRSGENHRRHVLKVSTNDSSFLVKIEKDRVLSGVTAKGTDEYASTLRAKDLLEDVPGVDVVEPLLGYQGTGRSYFVSRWINLPTVSKRLEQIEENHGTQEHPEYVELDSKARKIEAALSTFEDMGPHNMLYDASTGKIVLYDLSEKSIVEVSRSKLAWFR